MYKYQYTSCLRLDLGQLQNLGFSNITPNFQLLSSGLMML
jgi:hypothetical protein